MNIISVIEQEVKFSNDSAEGSSQYRAGYVEGLEVIAEFVSVVMATDTVATASCPAVKRMLEFWAINNSQSISFSNDTPQDLPVTSDATACPLDRNRNVIDGQAINEQEARILRMAVAVIRSHNNDYADFLKFWLDEYGATALSPNPPSLLDEMPFGHNLFDESIVVDAPRYIC